MKRNIITYGCTAGLAGLVFSIPADEICKNGTCVLPAKPTTTPF